MHVEQVSGVHLVGGGPGRTAGGCSAGAEHAGGFTLGVYPPAYIPAVAAVEGVPGVGRDGQGADE
eukprot:12935095-Prorocentrum_lima.AAC.1